MPPKAKFTKEEIILAAMNVVETEGIEALTARRLGDELGSSSRPIFTVFSGMNEVIAAVHDYANSIYSQFVESGLREKQAFRGVGKAYIRFAAERPRLFQLLFMKEHTANAGKETILIGIEDHYQEILQSIENEYGVDKSTATALYFHLWVYSHGIAVLIATKVCSFSEEEITKLLTEVFSALLKKIKTEGKL